MTKKTFLVPVFRKREVLERCFVEIEAEDTLKPPEILADAIKAIEDGKITPQWDDMHSDSTFAPTRTRLDHILDLGPA